MTLSPTLEKMKNAHKLLGEYSYELKPVERGYANRTLHVNLDDNTFAEKPVTQQMKDVFTGGRGFALLRREVMRLYYSQPPAWPSLGLDGPPQPIGFPDYTDPPQRRA